MKTSSAKAKGRRAAQEVRDAILSYFPSLHEDDIRVTPSSVTGEDLLLSPKAQEVLPYCFEVKNQEKLNLWDAIKQAKSHVKDARKPLLVFKRNHQSLYVTCDLETFLMVVARRVECLV